MSLDHLVSWAIEGGPAPVGLTARPSSGSRWPSEHLRTAGRSGAVYGLTTGVGALRNVPTDITPGDGTSHALRLWRSHATGFGDDVRRRDRARGDGDPAAPDHVRPLRRQRGARGVARARRWPRAPYPTCTGSARSAPATWSRSPSSG